MIFIVNVLFAILAYFVIKWLADQLTAPQPVGVVLGVIAAIVVYMANLAGQIVK